MAKPQTAEDPLLAELRDETLNSPERKVSLEFPDGTEHLAVDKSDPLAVGPKPQPSQRAQADAKHSIKAGGKGYRVWMEGEYFVRAQGSKDAKLLTYKIPFVLPDLSAPASVIVGKLLLPALKALNPDTVRYRTHEITKVEPLGSAPAPSNLAFMDRDALAQYAADNEVPIDPEDYVETAHLREALIDWKLNPDDAAKPGAFARREAKKQAQRIEEAQLKELNKDVLAPQE